MKPAFQKDEALLEDIEAARKDDSDTLYTWWLGQSGFLVMCGGKTVLFDPYLSDSLTRKYAETDNKVYHIEPISVRLSYFCPVRQISPQNLVVKDISDSPKEQ